MCIAKSKQQCFVVGSLFRVANDAIMDVQNKKRKNFLNIIRCAVSDIT